MVVFLFSTEVLSAGDARSKLLRPCHPQRLNIRAFWMRGKRGFGF